MSYVEVTEVTVVSRSLQPLIVVANKCDVKKINELSEENQVGDLKFRLDLPEISQSLNAWENQEDELSQKRACGSCFQTQRATCLLWLVNIKLL